MPPRVKVLLLERMHTFVFGFIHMLHVLDSDPMRPTCLIVTGEPASSTLVRRLVAISTACSLGSCCASLGMMAFALSGWGAMHRSPRHDDAGMREGMLWRRRANC